MKYFFMASCSPSNQPKSIETKLIEHVRENYQYHVLSEDDVPSLISAMRQAQRRVLKKNKTLDPVSIEEVISPTNASYRYINIGGSFFQLVEMQGPCEKVRQIDLQF